MSVLINFQTSGVDQSAGGLYVPGPVMTYPWKLGAFTNPWTFHNQIDQYLIGRYFTHTAPELCFRPEQFTQAEGQYNWSQTDQFALLAQGLGMTIRWHCACWPASPPWLFTGGDWNYTKLWFENICAAIATRYGSNFFESIDAVNEIVKPNLAAPGGPYLKEDNPWYIQALAGTGDGRNFVPFVFNTLRTYFPNAKLGWVDGRNDWLWETTENCTNAIAYAMSPAGGSTPVQWWGSQHHLAAWQSPYGPDGVVALTGFFLDRCELLGIKARITELDNTIYLNGAEPSWGQYPPQSLLQEQAIRINALFKLLRARASTIEEVTWFGTNDGYSWLNYTPTERVDRPLLFDARGVPKLTYLAMAGV